MMNQHGIDGFITVEEAAQKLGVTSHRVYSLIRAEELDALKLSARITLVDSVSLARLLNTGAEKGRPFSAPVAFGALWMLSGLEAPWLKGYQRQRASSSLGELNALRVIRRCRRRARRLQFFIAPSFLEKAAELISISGLRSADTYKFDLLGDGATAEGYIHSDGLSSLVNSTFAEPDSTGNLVVHVVDGIPFPLPPIMPEAVAAADLAESLNARTRAVGLQRLGGMLDEWRKARGT